MPEAGRGRTPALLRPNGQRILRAQGLPACSPGIGRITLPVSFANIQAELKTEPLLGL